MDPRSSHTTYQARHSPSSNSSRFFHIRFNQPTLTFTSSLGRGSSPPLIRTAQLLLQSLLSRPLSAAAVGDPAPHRLTSPIDDSFQCCFPDSTGTEKPHNLVNRIKRCRCNLDWAWDDRPQLAAGVHISLCNLAPRANKLDLEWPGKSRRFQGCAAKS